MIDITALVERASLLKHDPLVCDLLAALGALSSENERLRGLAAVLGGYAGHDDDCDANLSGLCDCGYSAVVRRASEALPTTEGEG
jgi:hypothetical protein